jgi:hypothetical protein
MLEFDSQSETGYIVPSTVPQIGSDFTMSSPAALMEVLPYVLLVPVVRSAILSYFTHKSQEMARGKRVM